MAVHVTVIFALDREAGPFRKLAKRGRFPVRVLVAGMGAEAARRAAEGVGDTELVASAGFCGALNPNLRVGDVFTFSGDAQRSAGASAIRCASPLNGVLELTTVSQLVATPLEKQALRDRTGADVVDMEAAAVAAVCAARGIPFLAVKAVSDAADTALSPRLANLLAGGHVSPRRATLALLAQPTLLFEFVRLARDTKLAAKNLAVELAAACRDNR